MIRTGVSSGVVANRELYELYRSRLADAIEIAMYAENVETLLNADLVSEASLLMITCGVKRYS